jgi:hypothetical protein
MNTQSEIMDALQDIQSNGMGILKEAFDWAITSDSLNHRVEVPLN